MSDIVDLLVLGLVIFIFLVAPFDDQEFVTGIKNETVTVVSADFTAAHEEFLGPFYNHEKVSVNDLYKTVVEMGSGKKLVTGDKEIFDAAKNNIGRKIIARIAEEERTSKSVYETRISYDYVLVGLA